MSILVYALPPNVYDDFGSGLISYEEAMDRASAEFLDDISWQAMRFVLDDDDIFFGGDDSPVDPTIRMHSPASVVTINARLQAIEKADFEGRVDVERMKSDGVADDQYWVDVGDPNQFKTMLFTVFQEFRAVFKRAADQRGGVLVSLSI